MDVPNCCSHVSVKNRIKNLFGNVKNVISDVVNLRIKSLVNKTLKFLDGSLRLSAAAVQRIFTVQRHQTAQNAKVAKEWLKQHRRDFKGESPEDLLPELKSSFVPNDTLFTCDSAFTKIYHKLAERFLSNRYLQEHLPDIKNKIRQLIQEKVAVSPVLTNVELDAVLNHFCLQVFMEYFVGCKSSVSGSFVEKSFDPVKWADKERWALIFSQCDSEDRSKIVGYMRSEGSFTESQIAGFAFSLLGPLMVLVPNATKKIIRTYAGNLEWQRVVFQALKQKSDQTQLIPEVLNVIVEQIRLSPPVSSIVRGGRQASHTVDLAILSRQGTVVGPRPNTFDPSRFREIKAWPLLPWLPFGRGPHMCPGWRLFQYLSAQFVEVLISDYQLSNRMRIIDWVCRFTSKNLIDNRSLHLLNHSEKTFRKTPFRVK